MVWDDSLEAHFNQWVIAEMKDGTRILGLLIRHSTGNEPREVYVARPERIDYDEQGKPERVKLGEAMLITETNLSSIRFLSSPTDFQVVYPNS